MTMVETRPTKFGSPSDNSPAPCSASPATLRGNERFRTVNVVADALVTLQPDDSLFSVYLSFPTATPMAVTFVTLRGTLGGMSFPETH